MGVTGLTLFGLTHDRTLSGEGYRRPLPRGRGATTTAPRRGSTGRPSSSPPSPSTRPSAAQAPPPGGAICFGSPIAEDTRQPDAGTHML